MSLKNVSGESYKVTVRTLGSSLVYIKKFPNNIVFLSLKIHFVLAKSVDPDWMLHYVAVHLGIHCLPMYPFRGFQSTRHKRVNTSLQCL